MKNIFSTMVLFHLKIIVYLFNFLVQYVYKRYLFCVFSKHLGPIASFETVWKDWILFNLIKYEHYCFKWISIWSIFSGKITKSVTICIVLQHPDRQSLSHNHVYNNCSVYHFSLLHSLYNFSVFNYKKLSIDNNILVLQHIFPRFQLILIDQCWFSFAIPLSRRNIFFTHPGSRITFRRDFLVQYTTVYYDAVFQTATNCF